jgi:pyridoxal phosphate enzyme (YggS family)
VLNLDVDLAGNLRRVQDQIAEAALAAGRDPSEITLVGVSKTQPVEMLAELVRAGLRHVGENRVQEAADKFPHLPTLLGAVEPPVRHMIGHLQSNKAGAAVALFDRVDSVDSVRLAQALSRRAAAHGTPLSVLIEVYVGDDPARPGVRPAQLIEEIGQILEVPSLRVDGLMSVAPLGGSARDAFAAVRALSFKVAQRFPAVHFPVLSMGMSDDFREAISEGATEVRIGTALFGPRRARF